MIALPPAPGWLDTQEIQYQLKLAGYARRGFSESESQLREYSNRGMSSAAAIAAQYAGRCAGELFHACDRVYDPWVWDWLAFRPHRLARIASEGRAICERCDGIGRVSRRIGHSYYAQSLCRDCDGEGSTEVAHA